MALELNASKHRIYEYVESRMSFIAPNLSIIIGASTAAKIMGEPWGQAGGPQCSPQDGRAGPGSVSRPKGGSLPWSSLLSQSAHSLGFLAPPPEKHLEGNLVGSCVSQLRLLTQCHRRGGLNN